MSVLPGQKLTIGELFVSMAMGLILYLLPGDLRNQTNSLYLSEALVFLSAFVITAVFFLIIKRYEAVGAMLITDSVITAGAFAFGIVRGAITGGGEYWPALSEYQLVTISILWAVPFFMTVLIRLFSHDARDTNETRMAFVRFLSLGVTALMILYIMVVVFRQIIPASPNLSPERSIYYVPFQRIVECFEHAGEWGMGYLMWNAFIVTPLTFSLMILCPKIKLWHILFVSFAFGLTIEIFQFAFNTGTVFVDDMLLYVLGGLVGFLLKRAIDYLRSLFTVGQDNTMMSLDYTPLEGRPQSVIEEFEEEDDFDKNVSDTSEFQLITDEVIKEHPTAQ